jgi:hypothetical protein
MIADARKNTPNALDKDKRRSAKDNQGIVDLEGQFMISDKSLSIKTLPQGVKIHELIGALDQVQISSLKNKLKFFSYPENEQHYYVHKSNKNGKPGAKLFSVWERSSFSQKLLGGYFNEHWLEIAKIRALFPIHRE